MYLGACWEAGSLSDESPPVTTIWRDDTDWLAAVEVVTVEPGWEFSAAVATAEDVATVAAGEAREWTIVAVE